MSYRFNKDTRNSKNTSFNKRSNNDFRSESNSNKTNYKDRRNSKNILTRSSSDQSNQYLSERQSSRRNRNDNQSNSSNNNRINTKFDRKPQTRSYRNSNSLPLKNEPSRRNSEKDSFAEPFSSHLSDDLIWGRHSTESALLAGRAIHRIWCTSELRSSPKFFQLLKKSKSSGVLVEEVSWSRLGQITKGAVHQGIVLQIAASKTYDLKNLIEACKPFGDSSLLLALDGLTDPQNLGAIIRSAEALGAQGLILPQRRSAGLTGSVAKVAAGALEHLPVARVVNLNRSLEKLKDEGYRVVGLAEEGDLTLPEVKFQGPLVVVVGAEDKGISLITRRLCDQLIRIPLKGVTTSLNASVATSIFLYEVARCGWMRSISGQAPSPRLVKPQILSDF
tara:strand:+ start:744 stop:1916 length:1173 start_codon:yes stop_codon:yes gene_type:complete